MRQVKFRYWNGSKVLNQEAIINHLNKYIARNDKHLMQFTGLFDKQGVEIYEGDIVLHSTAYKDTYVVNFKNGSFVANHTNTGDSRKICPLMFDRVEVIGNIHEDKK